MSNNVTEYNPGEGRHHFDRPETLLNRSVRWLADHRPHAELPQLEIEQLRDNSIAVFSGLVTDHEALEKVRSETNWYMTSDSCPSMVLSGEVTVDDDEQNPEVRFFDDAPVLAIKKARKREANLLGAADHFTGHLYAYFTGAADYDEHAAVYWQNRAAVARAEAGDKRFSARPLLNMLVYQQHKQIPLDVYSPQSLPFMKALGVSVPSVEACELRYPEVAGWARMTTDSLSSGIITSYRRMILSDIQAMPERPTDASVTANQEGGELWSIDFAGNDPQALDQLCLTKAGRPLKSDIAIVASMEQQLRNAGISAAEQSVSPTGGFLQVLGY
jgi:hypothetical protein